MRCPACKCFQSDANDTCRKCGAHISEAARSLSAAEARVSAPLAFDYEVVDNDRPKLPAPFIGLAALVLVALCGIPMVKNARTASEQARGIRLGWSALDEACMQNAFQIGATEYAAAAGCDPTRKPEETLRIRAKAMQAAEQQATGSIDAVDPEVVTRIELRLGQPVYDPDGKWFEFTPQLVLYDENDEAVASTGHVEIEIPSWVNYDGELEVDLKSKKFLPAKLGGESVVYYPMPPISIDRTSVNAGDRFNIMATYERNKTARATFNVNAPPQ